MAVITINPLEILDGDDITVIDLHSLSNHDTDPHTVLDALEAIQPLSVRVTDRLLSIADDHPDLSYTVLNDAGLPAVAALPRRLPFIGAYWNRGLHALGAPAVGLAGRYLVLADTQVSRDLFAPPF